MQSYIYVLFLRHLVLHCFDSCPVLVMGVVPSHMDSEVCACHLCNGQSEEAGEGHEPPGGFLQHSYMGYVCHIIGSE